jgi:hypothetical protein
MELPLKTKNYCGTTTHTLEMVEHPPPSPFEKIPGSAPVYFIMRYVVHVNGL